jgi:ABC-type multidrug transport system fused ATPase/permease subunit
MFDESTSSVDTYNERLIYNHLWRNFPNKTIIATIHRVNLLELFDYIYVLSKGEIVEYGDISDLQGQGGTFDRLNR